MTTAAPPPARSTGAAAAPPATDAVVTTTPGPVPAAPPIARPAARRTPTPPLVRRWLSFTIAALLLFTILGLGSLISATSTLADAGRSVGQLSRVEQIRTDLLRADASATHLFLGAEDAEHTEALAEARESLIEASTEFPADQAELRNVNRELDVYAARLAEARVARGTPAGTTALTEAGTQLHNVILPSLDTLVQANTQRVADRTTGLSSVPLAVSGILALAGLIGTAIVLGIRFRRLVNPGIAAALVLVAASFAIAQSTLVDAGARVEAVAQQDIATLRASAEARGTAYDARAQEGRALIQRAGGPTADQAWSTAARDIDQALARIPDAVGHDLQAAWERYVLAHESVRAAADQGRWDEAGRDAVGSGTDTAGGAFAVFDMAVTDTMNAAAAGARARLEEPRAGLTAAAVGVGLAGVAAILCTLAGVRPRLREYT